MGFFSNSDLKVDCQSLPAYLYNLKIVLPPGESILADADSLLYMDEGVDVTDVSDPTQDLLLTKFTNNKSSKATIIFSPPHIGRIEEIPLSIYDGKIICRQEAFLCALKAVSIAVNHSCSVAENWPDQAGIIMLDIQSQDTVYLRASGMNHRFQLSINEQVRVDATRLVAFASTVACEFGVAEGVKSNLWNGERLLLATLRGPGQVWMLSDPFLRKTKV
ncbi:MAG TPA: AIM24 family protein [Syntrophomonadaceae bacterium]|nr:AIM24 family protein [Syntrophomonadaceae bacterium]